MITSMNDWLSVLRGSHSAVAVPLIVGGLGLMLFGWRLWKVCVVLAFGLIGAGVGAYFAGPNEDQALYAVGCGAALAMLSYWPANYSVAVLGGAIGAGVADFYLSAIHLTGATLWAADGTAFIACTAFAYLNRRHVVILVTAFLGAVLVMSGLTAWVMASPMLFGTVRSMAAWSVIVVPFLLLVPTVMSCFYQIAEVRRLQIDF